MKRRISRSLSALLYAALPLLGTGCRSPYVQVGIENRSGTPLQLIEVDYPNASFGVDTLAASAHYAYHFKIQGDGPVTIQFTDASGKEHKSSGPGLRSGQQGSLTIQIGAADKVTWLPSIENPK